MTSWFVKFWNVLGVLNFTQIPKSVNPIEILSSMYLAYIILENGVQINPKKLNTILDWPVPTSIKEIQQFLGFCNFN